MLCAFFWVIPWCLNFVCQRFRTLCLFHLHRQKMEQTECSNMLAYKIQMPWNYPEESIQQLKICWAKKIFHLKYHLATQFSASSTCCSRCPHHSSCSALPLVKTQCFTRLFHLTVTTCMCTLFQWHVERYANSICATDRFSSHSLCVAESANSNNKPW